jgi:hypothetical protein
MKPSIIVWDLETVPDLAGFAAANDLVGKLDLEVREAIGDKSRLSASERSSRTGSGSLGGGRYRRPARSRKDREAADCRLVAGILIAEGLARAFVCGRTSCPPRQSWCVTP